MFCASRNRPEIATATPSALHFLPVRYFAGGKSHLVLTMIDEIEEGREWFQPFGATRKAGVRITKIAS
jgi:hypothetical protein